LHLTAQFRFLTVLREFSLQSFYRYFLKKWLIIFVELTKKIFKIFLDFQNGLLHRCCQGGTSQQCQSNHIKLLGKI
jgi:hypothetical protein